MVKSQIRTIEAIFILLMLGASHLSVTYSFAENAVNQEENGELRAILTERVVDGKLEVHRYALPDDVSKADLHRMLLFEGQMSWAFVNYKAYDAGIVLFDGKATKIGENLWEISIEQDVSGEELIYQVVFSGTIAETDEEEFVISLMNSLKNHEIGQNLKSLQIGEMNTNSEKSINSSQEFKNSISVI
ncbi:hypothetical protein [Nitrosopumilus sp.]|uniref:hypothetical protein n=1 Tax=Nitrosopumilus sp. TaxID=2024843 RepID=UPI00247D7A2D|nr:hypothetical protein [Nitrosopumilus sp.]MCV0430733.1 hypothetical protein [Nitrosopumilus sp.]